METMESIGLIIPGGVIMDSKIHRVPTDRRPRRKDGWYFITSYGVGAYGRFDTGEKYRYRQTGVDAEMARTAWLEANAQYRQAKLDAQVETSKRAKELWESGVKPTPKSHKYLVKKKIKPYNARLIGTYLAIPIYDGADLVNIQRIYPDGSKYYLPGGKILGCANKLGDGNSSKICICEGFATGSTIHDATGYDVFVSFQANNLSRVARRVRDKYKTNTIIICGDHDESGTGEKYGRQAATIIGAEFRMPDEIGDFNDVGRKKTKSVVDRPIDISILSKGEPEFSTQIDKCIYNVSGLISDGIEALRSCQIMQYKLPVVLSAIARAIAGKITIKNQWPCLYNIKVGGTSTGKTEVDQELKRAINIENFYGPSDFSSGPGLLRGLSEDNAAKAFITLDEITYIFKRSMRDDVIQNGIIKTLLELYTASGTDINRPYGDAKKTIKIKKPCVVLTGNATPNIFDDLRVDDLETGLLQRFDFWFYDGKIPYRQDDPNWYDDKMSKFINGLKLLMELVPTPKHKHDTRQYIDGPIDLPLNKSASEFLHDYSRKIIDETNQCADTGRAGIVSRKYNLALKYAMLHIASTRPAHGIFDPVTLPDLEWGAAVAKMLSEWKINKLIGKICTGDFHKLAETIKAGIKQCLKEGKATTLATIVNRRPKLLNIQPKMMADALMVLQARNEIIKYTDDSGKSFYYLCCM